VTALIIYVAQMILRQISEMRFSVNNISTTTTTTIVVVQFFINNNTLCTTPQVPEQTSMTIVLLINIFL
jgi:hypothetical protein